jgi:hypothetical protein
MQAWPPADAMKFLWRIDDLTARVSSNRPTTKPQDFVVVPELSQGKMAACGPTTK